MDLKHGDLVRTPDGVLGKVVQIDRVTAFVFFPARKDYSLKGFLISSLVLVPPQADVERVDVEQPQLVS
jgi:hypothetical protein